MSGYVPLEMKNICFMYYVLPFAKEEDSFSSGYLQAAGDVCVSLDLPLCLCLCLSLSVSVCNATISFPIRLSLVSFHALTFYPYLQSLHHFPCVCTNCETFRYGPRALRRLH